MKCPSCGSNPCFVRGTIQMTVKGEVKKGGRLQVTSVEESEMDVALCRNCGAPVAVSTFTLDYQESLVL